MNDQIRDLLERAEMSLLDYKSDIQFGSTDRDLLNDIRSALVDADKDQHAQGRSTTACDDQYAPEPKQ